ncbi:MAG: phosphatidate cytidylyltransferase [Gammaproteobacteria bacterium]|nr:phosphatidate cytidylyltransferase [Gammaproteobacteria bacterium]MDE2024458.1 phosphatidate cytidylyltransferase [Gammaproteobacteria bacterium]
MLKLRIVTAAILLPAVVALAWLAPTWALGLAAGVVALAAAWEWTVLSGVRAPWLQAGCTLLLAVLLIGFWTLRHNDWVLWITAWVALGWWLFALFWLGVWRREFPVPVKLLCGLLTLLPAWVATIALHASADGRRKLLFLLVLIWAADIAAYFAGRAFGRRKLAPEVSPGKTWEGVAGATLALLAAAFAGVFWALPADGYALILVCVLAGWLSIVGDLSESMFKREAGLKDSGRLFPGHGGVLDRIDSLTAALPAFWLGLAILERLK